MSLPIIGITMGDPTGIGPEIITKALSMVEPFQACRPFVFGDQGLIPIKMFDFKEAINFTLGLPFIRTSVAHGTAYDIVGKGLADPTNLVKTILMTANLSKLKINY